VRLNSPSVTWIFRRKHGISVIKTSACYACCCLVSETDTEVYQTIIMLLLCLIHKRMGILQRLTTLHRSCSQLLLGSGFCASSSRCSRAVPMPQLQQLHFTDRCRTDWFSGHLVPICYSSPELCLSLSLSNYSPVTCWHGLLLECCLADCDCSADYQIHFSVVARGVAQQWVYMSQYIGVTSRKSLG
jgi:hypothetical protein